MSQSDAAKDKRTEANRIGLDYRAAPPRRGSVKLIDVHTHVRSAADAGLFFEAAAWYGVERVLSMSPLENVDELRRSFGERIGFIAIPRWGQMKPEREFQQQWLADLAEFRRRGAKLCKFWMAPPMRERHGWTLRHEFLQPVIDRALELGFDFMTHIGDPSVWWRPGARYANTAVFGTKAEQFEQLEYFLERVRPRFVIGAHLGGSIEEPDFLQGLLDRHDNYFLDSSATKWIVREVARDPAAARQFVIRNAGRVLFGSDLVTGQDYDFDHYASRYWAHQMMWESDYRGESPIADPDADGPPRLAGLNLPIDVLTKMYRENAQRLRL